MIELSIESSAVPDEFLASRTEDLEELVKTFERSEYLANLREVRSYQINHGGGVKHYVGPTFEVNIYIGSGAATALIRAIASDMRKGQRGRV